MHLGTMTSPARDVGVEKGRNTPSYYRVGSSIVLQNGSHSATEWDPLSYYRMESSIVLQNGILYGIQYPIQSNIQPKVKFCFDAQYVITMLFVYQCVFYV